MSSRRVRSDIDSRSPIFTIDNSLFVVRERPVSAVIWIGLDGHGSLDKLLPVLFFPDEKVSDLEEVILESGVGSVNTPTYYNSPSTEEVEIEITYDIQPVSLSSESPAGDTPNLTHDSIREVARNWRQEYSQNAMDTTILGNGDPVFQYYCEIPIMRNYYNTYIPFFTEMPDKDLICGEASDIYIPCLSFVAEDETKGTNDEIEIKTKVTTKILELL